MVDAYEQASRDQRFSENEQKKHVQVKSKDEMNTPKIKERKHFFEIDERSLWFNNEAVFKLANRIDALNEQTNHGSLVIKHKFCFVQTIFSSSAVQSSAQESQMPRYTFK